MRTSSSWSSSFLGILSGLTVGIVPSLVAGCGSPSVDPLAAAANAAIAKIPSPAAKITTPVDSRLPVRTPAPAPTALVASKPGFDAHGCDVLVGAQWCGQESRCVKWWELADVRAFERTPWAVDLYCAGRSPPQRPAAIVLTDANGCNPTAGEEWCETDKRCVHWWDLAGRNGIRSTAAAARAYCAPIVPVVLDLTVMRDAAGCLPLAGYQWCSKEDSCVRWWELAEAKSLPHSPEAVAAHCAGKPWATPTIGSDNDANECKPARGYQWCKRDLECVRWWELAPLRALPQTFDAVLNYCAGG